MNSQLSPFKVNCNVIFALMMRELKSIYGDSRLGYTWEVLSTCFYIAIFWIIREFLRSFNVVGDLPAPIFLLAGFSLWQIFGNASAKSMAAIDGNRALLVFPQVLPLDLILARVTLIFYTGIFAAILLLVPITLAGYRLKVTHVDYIMISFALIYIISLGYGLIISSLHKFIQSMSVFNQTFSRILFFTSGVFFSLQELPPSTAEILSYNPLAIIFELHRAGYSEMIVIPEDDIRYATLVSLALLAIGLFSERATRKKLEL